MPRDFTINTIQKASEEYNKQYGTNIQLPVVFGNNNVITTRKKEAYTVTTEG